MPRRFRSRRSIKGGKQYSYVFAGKKSQQSTQLFVSKALRPNITRQKNCLLVPISLVTSLPAFLHPLLSAEISLHCSISVVKSEGEEGGGGGRRVLTTPFPPLLRRCEWQMQRRPPPRTQAHARSCRKKLPEQKRSFLLLSGDIVVVCTVCRSPLRCLSVKLADKKVCSELNPQEKLKRCRKTESALLHPQDGHSHTYT